VQGHPQKHSNGQPDTLLARPVDRRSALRLFGLALIVAACSKTTPKAQGSAGSPSGTPASPSPTPSSGRSPVPESERISDEVLRSDASFNGSYQATWQGSDGSKGAMKVTAAIVVNDRTAHGTIAIDPGFLGQGSGQLNETIELNLNDFAYEKPPYHVTSSIFGPITVSGMGRLYVQIDSAAVPGHPGIASFSAKGFLTGPDVLADGGMPFTYTIKTTDGKVVTGTAVFHPA